MTPSATPTPTSGPTPPADTAPPAAVPAAGTETPAPSGTPLSPTARSTIRRGADRARTERAELGAVLDAGLICHLGVVIDGTPRVLPTGYGHDGDTLFLHGSSGAASLRAANGVPVSVAITVVDGIVYARSVFDHSVNYRSAVVHGAAIAVTEDAAKLRALRLITEQLAPGSWDYARPPTAKELAKTAVLAVDLTEASVKVRSGPPADDEEDVATSAAWAGVLPIRTSWGAAEPDPLLRTDTVVPPHVTARPAPYPPIPR